MTHRQEYRQWPFLTEEEFELACALLDRRYIRAKLGPVRKNLKLRVAHTATTGTCYVEILRLLLPPKDEDDLSNALEKLSSGYAPRSAPSLEVEMMDDDGDEEVLRPDSDLAKQGGGLPRYSFHSHQPYVTYEIHLHPTYRMPTLWFTLHDLPMNEPAFDLNSVYRYLVPEGYKSQLRAVGVMGGISAAPHPLTDVPAFFIHPCQTKEAIENFNCPINDYMMLWIGLVGACVGLWMPPEMAEDI
ncbi:autophagy 3 protein [Rutstroemia sp. NJR-2017a BBW]|nr:autophagy 3 protein [Rutstroemia sp. NJR-2017a BBW]